MVYRFWAVLYGAAFFCAALPLSARDIAVITSQNAGAVTLVDPADGSVLVTVPMPGKPAAVAVDRQGRSYVVAVDTALLHVLGPDGGTIRQIALPGAPFGVAVNPISRMIYVSDWEGTQIHEVDSEAGLILRSFQTGAAPSGIAVTPDGQMIVTADRDANQISLIDAASGEAQTVAVGEHPFGVSIYDGRAFVANVLADSVSVVDMVDRRVIATIPVGERPYAVAFAGGRGFVTNQYAESVTVFDAASYAVLTTIMVGEYPEGIAATADETRVLVANWFSDTVSVIDVQTLTVVQDIDMPEGPRAFGAFIAAMP